MPWPQESVRTCRGHVEDEEPPEQPRQAPPCTGRGMCGPLTTEMTEVCCKKPVCSCNAGGDRLALAAHQNCPKPTLLAQSHTLGIPSPRVGGPALGT